MRQDLRQPAQTQEASTGCPKVLLAMGQICAERDCSCAASSVPAIAYQGLLSRCLREPTRACIVELATALRNLNEENVGSDHELYDFVIGFIAPLPLLRRTVEDWSQTLDKSSQLFDTAKSVALVLTPSCVADRVKTPKSTSVPLMPDVPVRKAVCAIPRVVSGCALCIKLPEPPSARLPYPFTAPVPLTLAVAITDWVEASCKRVGAEPSGALRVPSKSRWARRGPLWGLSLGGLRRQALLTMGALSLAGPVSPEFILLGVRQTVTPTLRDRERESHQICGQEVMWSEGKHVSFFPQRFLQLRCQLLSGSLLLCLLVLEGARCKC